MISQYYKPIRFCTPFPLPLTTYHPTLPPPHGTHSPDLHLLLVRVTIYLTRSWNRNHMHIACACVHTSPISFVTFPRPACNKGNHGRRHAGYVRMRRALRSSGNNVLIPLTSLLLHECVENFVGVTILNLKSVEKSLALRVVYSSASSSDLENLIVTRFATCTSPINYFIYPLKFCKAFVFYFSWVLQPTQEEFKTICLWKSLGDK